MAFIIDDTFFIRELAIPTISDMGSKAADELNQFIDEKGRLLLDDVIGYANRVVLESYLVNGLLPAVPADPDPDPVPEKWRNLVEGCTYTIDDVEYRWKGLQFTEGSFKGSLMAYFVYSYWYAAQVSYVSGVGDVQASAKNAPHVNPNQRYVNAWNKFIEMYQGNCQRGYGYTPTILYNGIPFTDYFGGQSENGNVSLIKFLQDNESDYDNCPLRTFEIKNQLGL
jgi:hypothetical protein